MSEKNPINSKLKVYYYILLNFNDFWHWQYKLLRMHLKLISFTLISSSYHPFSFTLYEDLPVVSFNSDPTLDVNSSPDQNPFVIEIQYPFYFWTTIGLIFPESKLSCFFIEFVVSIMQWNTLFNKTNYDYSFIDHNY